MENIRKAEEAQYKRVQTRQRRTGFHKGCCKSRSCSCCKKKKKKEKVPSRKKKKEQGPALMIFAKAQDRALVCSSVATASILNATATSNMQTVFVQTLDSKLQLSPEDKNSSVLHDVLASRS